MNQYLVKTPKLVQRMYPKRIWKLPNDRKSIFLTFDDGPIPEVTPWVLDTLAAFNAKATFFCIGENIHKNPKIFQRILDDGHDIGNHTYHHRNGWKTSTQEYLENVALAQAEIELWMKPKHNNALFRPPYGKLTIAQSKLLQQHGYSIVMWDVLSFDWDADLPEDHCFQNVSKHMEEGSIIVFHDSLKAENNLRYTLPKVLQKISDQGWNCRSISK